MESGRVHDSPVQTYFNCQMMNPESIYYLFESGIKEQTGRLHMACCRKGDRE